MAKRRTRNVLKYDDANITPQHISVDLEIADRFADFLFDWDYKYYLLIGGYGSGKSYNAAEKLVIKCLQERRKVLVVREVYDTIRDSCFDLLCEILDKMDMLCYDRPTKKKHTGVVYAKTSPMQLIFENGSKIIFKGMDKPGKLKSINGVTDVWLEECSEIKYSGFKEIVGRLRTEDVHFILTTNPVDKQNWVYTHFFKRMDDDGNEVVVLDDERLYKKKTLVKNDVYYHHSVVDDNPFIPTDYVKTLNDMAAYDPDLYRVARLGRFGTNGLRVLPQFEVAETHEEVMDIVRSIDSHYKFNGMDFGFETSYNAVVRTAVDDKEKILYIFDELYKNGVTDDQMVPLMKKKHFDAYLITADNEDPKAINYYKHSGFNMRKCKKWAGSRLSNTRKVKRFRKIVCSPHCINTIRELKDLTYKVDNKGNIIYDKFNIDPHTFSAIWYALDRYNVADLKERKFNSRKGA